MRKFKVFCAALTTVVVVGLAPLSALAADVSACPSGAQCTKGAFGQTTADTGATNAAALQQQVATLKSQVAALQAVVCAIKPESLTAGTAKPAACASASSTGGKTTQDSWNAPAQ
jgi:hypothetical protein